MTKNAKLSQRRHSWNVRSTKPVHVRGCRLCTLNSEDSYNTRRENHSLSFWWLLGRFPKPTHHLRQSWHHLLRLMYIGTYYPKNIVCMQVFMEKLWKCAHSKTMAIPYLWMQISYNFSVINDCTRQILANNSSLTRNNNSFPLKSRSILHT